MYLYPSDGKHEIPRCDVPPHSLVEGFVARMQPSIVLVTSMINGIPIICIVEPLLMHASSQIHSQRLNAARPSNLLCYLDQSLHGRGRLLWRQRRAQDAQVTLKVHVYCTLTFQ